MFSHNDGGYTLLETLLAVTVIMFVLTAALRLLSYTSASAVRTIIRCELTESARIAANVMSVNIQRSSQIKITLNGDTTLKQMDLRDTKYTFKFDSGASAAVTGYHRLIFSGPDGSNELASNIARIYIIRDSPDILIIEIETDNTITNSGDLAKKRARVTVEPVIIRVPVNIAGKDVKF